MKKVIILVALLLTIASTALAEQGGVYMQFHRKINPEKHLKVDRAPMRLPIDVVYDTDALSIEISSETIEAEVYVYDSASQLIDYSSTLNTTFYVPTPATYVVVIQGDEWYAEGVIAM